MQDYGFDGSFEEWYWEAYGEESPTAAVRRLSEPQDEIEQVIATLAMGHAVWKTLLVNHPDRGLLPP